MRKGQEKKRRVGNHIVTHPKLWAAQFGEPHLKHGPAHVTPWRSDSDEGTLKKCWWWSEGEGGGKDAEANWDGTPRNESVIK
jgi:hypothetical protein